MVKTGETLTEISANNELSSNYSSKKRTKLGLFRRRRTVRLEKVDEIAAAATRVVPEVRKEGRKPARERP